MQNAIRRLWRRLVSLPSRHSCRLPRVGMSADAASTSVCATPQARLKDYLDGADISPALAAHLASCETCLEACLEAALRQPLDVPVPPDFTAQALDRLPPLPETESTVLPYFLVAACVLFTVMGITAISSGWLATLTQSVLQIRPTRFLAVLGCEAALSLAWFWRVSKA